MPQPDRPQSDQLGHILAQHQAIALALQRVAAESMGRPRQYAKSLAKFFADGPSRELVLNRPDALAICLPLLVSSDQQPATWRYEDAANQGLDQLAVFEPPRKRLLLQIGYPLVVLLLAIFLGAAYLLFLVPIFDDMFQEFGLQLAPATQAVIQASRLLRFYWPIVLGILVAGVVVIAMASFFPKRAGRPVWSGRLRFLLTNTGDALSAWAWHVGMLIESGLPIGDAIDAAGLASDKGWLQQKSRTWAAQSRAGAVPMGDDSFVHQKRCHLLSYAVGADLADDATNIRPELLREVALIFRDNSQHQWSSVLAWLSPVLLMLVSMAIGFFVVAVMSPLISLIGGLS